MADLPLTASGVPMPQPSAWMSEPVTGEMLLAVLRIAAQRSVAPEVAARIVADVQVLLDSQDPNKASDLLKPEKRGRGRPKSKTDDGEKKHRDLGSYNLFVMKAQHVAGGSVQNHRAFMALIGNFWKACASRCAFAAASACTCRARLVPHGPAPCGASQRAARGCAELCGCVDVQSALNSSIEAGHGPGD